MPPRSTRRTRRRQRALGWRGGWSRSSIPAKEWTPRSAAAPRTRSSPRAPRGRGSASPSSTGSSTLTAVGSRSTAMRDRERRGPCTCRELRASPRPAARPTRRRTGSMTLPRSDIVRLDKARVWHPYTAMDAYIADVDPIVVTRDESASLYDADGRSFLDGNASWFVVTLGYAHPRLVAALTAQAATLAHCALAGIAHEPAARLADELVAVAPKGLSRVFFTDDGSTAVEVAVKMAVQMWRQLGAPGKTRFVALDGAFHGDSLGATSLGGGEVFRRPFAGILFECVHAPFPEPSAYERAFDAMREIVTRDRDRIAAVVVEPVVQGSAGMRVYDPAYLRELSLL